MHGCGNDFMIIDLRHQTFNLTPDKIKHLANYKTSVGFDQLLTIEYSETADIKTRIFNNDGSEIEACGNGSRCLAKLILEERFVIPGKRSATGDLISIETTSRILTASLQGSLIAVNMGEAELVEENIQFEETSGSLINIGNPHIIINNTQNLDPLKLGPIIENDPRFPNKVNVNFAKIINKNLVELRTWERGAGATLACGSGACATFFLLNSKGLINKEALIKQLGGDLNISLHNNQILMAGQAHISYKGIIGE
jgi:diaminopimelate epimerase